MAKTELEKDTRLELYLSTGNKIICYYKGGIYSELEEDLQSSISRGYSWLAANYTLLQMCIEDGDGHLLFSPKADDPVVIDSRKIIGWSIYE